uniref:dimethylaniline monooxygenase [N-oxide-forming] 2-like n=1 Tax=Ictidomys tridecemlineatus TaxID=43179 RepID=UPI001A9D0DEE|nr:dimethylaniline monooxygenase [N-oxide-forming] 2-like [Ictidomys tridecemlineatus]
MAKKVAVIGAGVSGLVSLKCCVDEGLEPTCFERTEDIGGLWRFKVFISTRKGSWVLSRISEDGYPWDSVFHTRFSSMLRNILPRAIVKWMLEQQMNRWFNHENYGLQPENKYLLKEPILNDDLPSRILYGAVKVKPRVTGLTETAAIFEDETVEEDIDVIVFATGYTFAFPFLEESLVKVEDGRVSLYKHMFPPQLEKATLACMGLIQPLGSIFPTVELQARWATRVFKGEWAACPPTALQRCPLKASPGHGGSSHPPGQVIPPASGVQLCNISVDRVQVTGHLCWDLGAQRET